MRTLYLVEETSPNGCFSHALKERIRGQSHVAFVANSAEECERWASAEIARAMYWDRLEYGNPPEGDTHLDVAMAAWHQLGDCDLGKWENGTGTYTVHVKATGQPPRCRTSYTHVFLFQDGWRNGKPASILVAILRASGERIEWLPNSQAYNAKHTYRWLGQESPYFVV